MDQFLVQIINLMQSESSESVGDLISVKGDF